MTRPASTPVVARDGGTAEAARYTSCAADQSRCGTAPEPLNFQSISSAASPSATTPRDTGATAPITAASTSIWITSDCATGRV